MKKVLILILIGAAFYQWSTQNSVSTSLLKEQLARLMKTGKVTFK